MLRHGVYGHPGVRRHIGARRAWRDAQTARPRLAGARHLRTVCAHWFASLTAT